MSGHQGTSSAGSGFTLPWDPQAGVIHQSLQRAIARRRLQRSCEERMGEQWGGISGALVPALSACRRSNGQHPLY